MIVSELNLIGVFTSWNVYEGQDHAYAYQLFYDRVVLPAAHSSISR